MKILFICTANVCRSPLAEGYLKYLLQKNSRNDLEVSSAGILARPGYPAFECAIEVARLHQFDLTNHKARQLTPSMLQETDSVFCMESWQAAKAMELDPKSSYKVALLGRWHSPDNNLLQIRDPLEFDVTETSRTFEIIRIAVENYLFSISPPNPPS